MSTAEEDLKVGSFYWVISVLDVDTELEWVNQAQPARFSGREPDGTLLWHCLSLDGESDWPMRWIGSEIC